MKSTQKIIKNKLEKFQYWIKRSLKSKNKESFLNFIKAQTIKFKKMNILKDISSHRSKSNKFKIVNSKQIKQLKIMTNKTVNIINLKIKCQYLI